MSNSPDTIRIVIPLALKRRNGRPRIVPPADIEMGTDGCATDPRLLRAIARAWDWRRRLERGEAATLTDIAATEGVTVPFISRLLRLAYLSPVVLEQLLINHRPCPLSLDRLAAIAQAPWQQQPVLIFEE